MRNFEATAEKLPLALIQRGQTL